MKDILKLIMYADGENSLIEIADRINVYAGNLIPIAEQFLEKNLFEIVS